MCENPWSRQPANSQVIPCTNKSQKWFYQKISYAPQNGMICKNRFDVLQFRALFRSISFSLAGTRVPTTYVGAYVFKIYLLTYVGAYVVYYNYFTYDSSFLRQIQLSRYIYRFWSFQNYIHVWNFDDVFTAVVLMTHYIHSCGKALTYVSSIWKLSTSVQRPHSCKWEVWVFHQFQKMFIFEGKHSQSIF